MNRRKLLQGIASGATAAVASPLLPGIANAASGSTGKSPKRVIFFLQNQGFDPATCVPSGMKNSGSLANAKLPEPIEALEPYKERLHIINGLHGTHTSPSHSPFFGALGGYRGGDNRNGNGNGKPRVDVIDAMGNSVSEMVAKITKQLEASTEQLSKSRKYTNFAMILLGVTLLGTIVAMGSVAAPVPEVRPLLPANWKEPTRKLWKASLSRR